MPGSRPTSRTSLPFEALLALGVLLVALPPYRGSWGHAVAIVATSAGLYAAHRASLRRTHRTWLDLVAPLGVFPLVVVLRDATGGLSSGLSPLVIVPVIWLSVFGTRRDLAAAIPLVAVTFVTPILLIGGDAYPPSEWRRAFVLTGVAAILAPAVQRVVRRFAQETRRSRETAARLEGVIRGATLSALVTTDLDGRITSFGVGAESLLGYSAETVTGRDPAQAFFDRAELVTVARELEVEPGFAVFTRLAHQHAGSRVWSMVRADGERVFVLMSATELRDDQGTLTGHLLVAIDATSSIVSQRALTQAEERWRALMDHLPETAVIMVEERTGITVVTGAGVLVHKLRDGAGRRLTQILDQAGPGTLTRILDMAFAGWESDAVHVPVEGAEHEFTVSPLPAVGGRRQALLMARDVSRDRQRERVLTAAKERAERMFKDAPQGIALLDLAGVVRQANPALQLLLGGADLVGRPLSSWSYDAGDAAVATHLEQVRTTDDHRSEMRWTIRGARDEQLHVVLVSTMLEAEDGDVDQILTNVMDVSERHRYERQLAFLAEHDPLTGLANRRRFDQDLARHIDDCVRYGPRGALLMLDLDNFKHVNDTLGHGIGDELLVEVAALLDDRLRSTDLVARLGGDEFALLLPHADRKAAELVADDVVRRVAELAARYPDGRAGVTVSVGGVVVGSSHRSSSDLLSAADAAMYVAKHSGRGRFAFLDLLED